MYILNVCFIYIFYVRSYKSLFFLIVDEMKYFYLFILLYFPNILKILSNVYFTIKRGT